MPFGAWGPFHHEEGEEGVCLPLYQAVRAEAGLGAGDRDLEAGNESSHVRASLFSEKWQRSSLECGLQEL